MKLASFAVALALATAISFAADPPKADPNTPSANAAKPPPPKAYINEAEAGPDFKIQGEYLGEAGDRRPGGRLPTGEKRAPWCQLPSRLV